MVRLLFPSSILITTIVQSDNPIVVNISPTSHITIDTLTVLRVTPEYANSSILTRLSKPLFSTSYHPLEVSTSDSFVIVYVIFRLFD